MADGGYKHLNGSAFDASYGGIKRETYGAEGCFAKAETVSEIEAYP